MIEERDETPGPAFKKMYKEFTSAQINDLIAYSLQIHLGDKNKTMGAMQSLQP